MPQAKIEPITQPDSRHESDLRGALKNENAPATTQPPTQPQTSKTPPPAAAPEGEEGDGMPDVSQDYQLARAVDLLRGLALYASRSVN